MGPAKDIKVPPLPPKGAGLPNPQTKMSSYPIYACLAVPHPSLTPLHLDFHPQLFHPHYNQPSPFDRVGLRAGKTARKTTRFGAIGLVFPTFNQIK